MKKRITLLFCFGVAAFAQAQIAQAGDIAFVGFNADGGDDFAIVTFKDITPNTTIYFCDSEWNGSAFGTDEGDFTWNSGLANITAGTIITFSSVSSSLIPSAGLVTFNNAGGLSTDADAMFAFLGTAPRTVTTMLAAIANDASAFGSLENTGLTAGATALIFGDGTDIAVYDGPRTGLDAPGYAAAVSDESNWLTENTAADDSTNGTSPDLPFSLTAFDLGGINPSTPSVSFDSEFVYVNENDGTASAILNISTAFPQDVVVSVGFMPSTATAVGGTQFTFVPQEFTFPANSTTSVPITIPIIDNNTAGNDTYFVLQILSATNATVGTTSTKAIYIKDDEIGAAEATNALDLDYVTSYLVDANGSAEIVVHDPVSQRLFVVNSTATKLAILDFSNLLAISEVAMIDMSAYGIGATSVSCKNGLVAVTVEGADFGNGKVVFMDTNGQNIQVVEAGVLPDMITFTPDGSKVLTANEGQPNSDYSLDPQGSISVIDVSGGLGNINQADVSNINFNAFDSQLDALKAQGIRIFGPGSSVSEDLEPEYITVSADGAKAWVTLQENNAIAVVDLTTNTVSGLLPLGTKDHNVGANAFDSSDQSGQIFMANWPVKGMFMPDAVANYSANGTTYLVTANEGDVREYDNMEEEIKVGDADYILDPTIFPNATFLKKNRNLGRLAVTNQSGDIDNDGDFDEIHSFGGRSFSIWNSETGDLVYDSAADFERITAADPVFGALFNSSNDNSTLKNRSDNKGPEPEGVTIGQINGSTYAFITLERIGGVMVYDISNPASPQFVSYKNSRQTSGNGGDLGPEGIIYIKPQDSPTQTGLVVLANEISATLSIYQITNDVLGSEDHVLANNRLAYPNPVKNGVLFFAEPVNAELFDISGRLVLSKANTSSLDVTSLSKGIYMVKANGEIAQKIIVE